MVFSAHDTKTRRRNAHPILPDAHPLLQAHVMKTEKT